MVSDNGERSDCACVITPAPEEQKDPKLFVNCCGRVYELRCWIAQRISKGSTSMVFLRVLVCVATHCCHDGGAIASPCGKSEMTALRAIDGSSFLFYLFREGPDIAYGHCAQRLRG